MRNSFFSRIDRATSEDLTTEILAYILSSNNYAPYQRLFYSMIFHKKELKDTVENGFDISTQVDLGELGRPDIIIESDSNVMVIENKFYASFNLDNQMLRYFSFLKNLPDDREKTLILLTIKGRIATYLKSMHKQFNLVSKDNEELKMYCKKAGVEFKWLFWEDLFRVLGNQDFLFNNLRLYIEDRFITSSILEERELKMVNSKDIPMLMEKLWSAVDKTKNMLGDEDFNVMRSSQSRNFYGFHIGQFWGKIWFGFYHDCWRDNKTPIVFQLRKGWIEEEYHFPNLEKSIKNLGFIHNEDLEYVYLIKVDQEDLPGTIFEESKKVLRNLDDLFLEAGKK